MWLGLRAKLLACMHGLCLFPTPLPPPPCIHSKNVRLVQELAPKHAQIHATLDLFPGLTALDLSGMPHHWTVMLTCR